MNRIRLLIITAALLITMSATAQKAEIIRKSNIYSDTLKSSIITTVRKGKIIVLDYYANNNMVLIKCKNKTGWIRRYNITTANIEMKAAHKEKVRKYGRMISSSKYNDMTIAVYKKGSVYTTLVNDQIDSIDTIIF